MKDGDNLLRLVYETYFNVTPRDRQGAEWFVKPELWAEIKKLSVDNIPVVIPVPGEVRCFLMGLPVNVDAQVDWIELRAAMPTRRSSP